MKMTPTKGRIVLFAAGNSEIGMGHISRTATLAYTLTLNDLIQQSVTVVWECSEDLLVNFTVGNADVKITADQKESQQQLEELAGKNLRSVLVIDFFEPFNYPEFRKNEYGYSNVVFLNDNGWSYEGFSLIVDSDGFKSRKDMPHYCHDIALIGPNYQIIRPEVTSIRPKQSWNKSKVQHLLVSLGSSDPANLTHTFISSWVDSPKSNGYITTVVVGPHFSYNQRECIDKLIKRNKSKQLKLERAPSNLAQLMVSSDVLISLGGITAYEAMCLGCPVVALAWKHMGRYVQALDKAHLLWSLGNFYHRSDMSAIVERFENILFNIQNFGERANNAFSVIDGQGATRVSNALLDLLRK